MPPIGTVLAAGLTVDELDQLLKPHGRTVGVVIRQRDPRGFIELFKPGRKPSRIELAPDIPNHRDAGLGCLTCS